MSSSDLAVKGPRVPGGVGHVVVPDSSIERPGDAGKRLHTNFRIFVPGRSAGGAATPQISPAVQSPPNPPYAGYAFETPASLACVYLTVARTPGCNPNVVTTSDRHGAKVIAIVDAYHNSTALADLQAYSTQFGLPAPNLQVVFASGTQPAADFGWAMEEALDLDMAHAMAPNAKIILVEAATNSYVNLNAAVDVASTMVAQAGGGEVSMSYGGSEFSTETSLEGHFTGKTNVVFFASTGDDAGTEWPSVSPNVVAVGGTSVSRVNDFPTSGFGNTYSENVWQDTGGGISRYFPRPSYQSGIASRYANIDHRFVPDIAAVANPATGVWVYCGAGCGSASGDEWLIFGGTSVASPLMASLVNYWATFRASSAAQLAFMYSKIGSSAYADIGYGNCGPYAGYFASTAAAGGSAAFAHDLCTGLGAPRGSTGL